MNQSNLTHQHVYYSNRFEPGKLFPEIITNGFNNNLYGDQTLRALLTYGFVAPETFSTGGDTFTVTSIGEYRLQMPNGSLYSHIPLYYTAPTDDFVLTNTYLGISTFSGTSESSYSLESQLLYTRTIKDHAGTLTASVESTFASVLGTINALSPIPVTESTISMTNVPSDLIMGSIAFDATIQ